MEQRLKEKEKKLLHNVHTVVKCSESCIYNVADTLGTLTSGRLIQVSALSRF